MIKMKKLNLIVVFSFLILVILTHIHCNVSRGFVSALMPDISEDVKIGAQTSQEIANNTEEFPLLPESGNEQVYNYVRGITTKILNSSSIKHRKDFPWVVKIIKDDKTLNAFCTPGGYIYVYTGLIKYLDSEDQLAGVLGHEIAHADNRHSMQQIVQLYGIQALASIGAQVLTKNSGESTQKAAVTVAQVTTALVGLKFSRAHETGADVSSVHYLCSTDYNAAGSAAFFEKISKEPTPPEWLSTHPNPANRVQNIYNESKKASCTGSNKNAQQYLRIKQLL
jgi:beta-barrel assembly-enhancing protease